MHEKLLFLCAAFAFVVISNPVHVTAGKPPSIVMIEEYRSYAASYVKEQPRQVALDLPAFVKHVENKYGPPTVKSETSPLWFLKVPDEEGWCVTLELFQSHKTAGITWNAGVLKCNHPKYLKKGILPR
jgi:hypothetical protein